MYKLINYCNAKAIEQRIVGPVLINQRDLSFPLSFSLSLSLSVPIKTIPLVAALKGVVPRFIIGKIRRLRGCTCSLARMNPYSRAGERRANKIRAPLDNDAPHW